MRSGALPTRDRHRLRALGTGAAWEGPGSAVHRSASLHAAPRPGNVTLFVFRARRSAVSAFPGRSAARNEVERCAADPGPSQAPRSWHAPRLGRPRISGAPLRAAPRPGNVTLFVSRAQRSIDPRIPGAAQRAAVRCRPGTVTGSALLARATLAQAPDQRCTVPLRSTLHRV